MATRESTVGRISLVAATALGVGGMMGAGLYTLLGFAAKTAGTFVPIAFAVAAVVAGFSVYSYSKLGATFPSRGGAAHFIVKEFGDGAVAGGINVFQYFGYLVATALYAAGFAEYVRALVGGMPDWSVKAVSIGIVLVFLLISVVNTKLVGRSETVIVGVELVILVGFIAVGAFRADSSQFAVNAPDGALGVVSAAALLYVTYQGFGVIANASSRMGNPRKELPRAMFIALALVATLYILISVVVVLVVPEASVVADAGHVLADAGQALAGRLGFVVIAVAALLATSSAVNATLFASSSVAYDESESGELPRSLTRTVGRSGNVALVASAALISLLVLFFPLGAVGQMTSLAFLLVYGAVSYGHVKLRHQTGARRWPLVVAVAVNAALFIALLAQAVKSGQVGTWATLVVALIASFVAEVIVRRRHPAKPADSQVEPPAAH